MFLFGEQNNTFEVQVFPFKEKLIVPFEEQVIPFEQQNDPFGEQIIPSGYI